ncbi:MAG: RecX family transcriptional regulator [Bacteroidales bacterium]|nr:RecX family transcriptional regulator [Bacteroidales bacterium]MDE7127489.1 RecX family transcriptional regulator [Bacteroidales bacterium]
MQKKNTCGSASQAGLPKEKVLDRMRRLCSRREYCSADIRAKVAAALAPGCGDGDSGQAGEDMGRAIEEIMSSLLSDRYVDDLRYATAFARDKSSLAGWGETKIRYALSAKRIDKDVISAALDEIDDGKASARLEKLLETKYRSLCRTSSSSGTPADGGQIRLKLLRFALSRGYSYEEASSVIGRLSAS